MVLDLTTKIASKKDEPYIVNFMYKPGSLFPSLVFLLCQNKSPTKIRVKHNTMVENMLAERLQYINYFVKEQSHVNTSFDLI